jgi:hypothetical protein
MSPRCRQQVDRARRVALIWGVSAGAALAQNELKITEIDYDEPGPDTAEWIEIQNVMDYEIFVTGASLVLYDADLNGSCTEYCRVDLSALGILNAGRRVVIGAHHCAVLPLCTDTDAIQNGAPDAIAIEWDGEVVDSVEYESSMTHTMCVQLPDWRTSAADNDSEVGSLRSCWAWQFVTEATPCADNNCQPTDVPESPDGVPVTLVKSLYE